MWYDSKKWKDVENDSEQSYFYMYSKLNEGYILNSLYLEKGTRQSQDKRIIIDFPSSP